MLYIGVDLGTSAVKLLLMQEDGSVKKIVTKEYPLSFPHPGWSEQNPSDWWTQSIAGLKELTADCDKSQIAGISFGGQMHGLVILDEHDEVIRPAILWNDGRTTEETEYLNTVIGRERLSALTGNIAFAGFTAPKILWVQKHEPENFARIHKLMLPKDYLAYRLTGVSSTDYSDASGMLLLDVEHKCWSKEMLDICSVKEEWMPQLFESYEKTGTLLPEVAKELGFPESCIVAAGAGDNAAAAVGTGCVGAGKCNLSLGTSGTMFITNSTYGVDPYNALHSFAHADGSYHLMGCMLSAASCNKWWMEDILKTGDFSGEQAPIDERAAAGKLGGNHVYFLPYLMGERSPHNDPKAKGAFIGMSLDTSRADMLQAVFEGVAYALRDSLEVARRLGVAPERTTICGGGAKSPLWRRIVANIMNMKVDTVEVEEGPAYGGAILAAVADGAYANVGEAVAKIVRIRDTTEPEAALVARYEEGYRRFAGLYPALKDAFQTLI
jgi:xylulokinase